MHNNLIIFFITLDFIIIVNESQSTIGIEQSSA